MGIGPGDLGLSRVDAIVFDLDDTLYEKAAWLIPAIEFAARKMGFDAERATGIAYNYVQDRGCADAGIYNDVLLGCGQSDSALNIRAFVSLVNQFTPAPHSLPLQPGGLNALIELHRHYRLGLIADGPVAAQRAKVAGLGITQFFYAVVFSDSIDGIRSRRPDPRPYRLLAAELGLRPPQILFVADNPLKDFKQARLLGFRTARVLTGEYSKLDYPSQEHAAECEISSISRLPDVMAVKPAPVEVIAEIKPPKLALAHEPTSEAAV